MQRTSITAQFALVVALVSAGLVTGCARQSPGPDAGGTAAAPAETIAPPAGSPLAKVTVGMTPREVEDVLGRPDGENQYVTGKAFAPWYFGPDRSRRAFFYEGVGRVVFQAGSGFTGMGNYTVRHVEHDPTEDGRAE